MFSSFSSFLSGTASDIREVRQWLRTTYRGFLPNG